MSQKRHETTSGASANEGREYEDVLSTYLCLKASYDEDCRHFELASNVKGYGSADDVIFRKDGELFLVQLKWKQNAGVINRLSFKFLWHTTPPPPPPSYFQELVEDTGLYVQVRLP